MTRQRRYLCWTGNLRHRTPSLGVLFWTPL
jgi:hypothetical protein